MQTQNLYYFFVWYVITCHPTSYRASHNRFSVIIFDDYLYHCRIFLALFLITTVLKPSYSLLTLRASWLVWCLYRFYQRNKSRCRCKWDVTIEYLTRAIFEKQLTALHVVSTFHRFNRYVFILLTKMRTETKTVPSTWYIFNVQGCTHTDFHICALYCYWLTWGTGEFLKGKAKRFFRDWPFVYVTGGFISHQFGDYANINLWKSDNM